MSFRTGRKMNNGNLSGMKQDRFRNSDFDYRQDQEWREYDDETHVGGVSRVTSNTLGVGPFNENRGRRGDQVRLDNPFENGELTNWAARKGWDQYFGSQRGRGPRNYQRPDDRIYEDVCERLSRAQNIDASEIEVSVKQGIVYLHGSVSDRGTKRAAEFEIDFVSGVRDVQNLLSISGNSGSNREKGSASETNSGNARLS